MNRPGIVLLALWVCAAFLQASPQPEATRFVVFNVRNYQVAQPDSASTGTPPRPKPDAEIAELVELVVSLRPDVLGLLEMGGRPAVDDFRNRLAEAGLDLPHAAMVSGADAGRQTALLSRFPIPGDHSPPLPRFALDARWETMQRGILDVEIELPGIGATRFVGVHLKSRRPDPEFDQAALRLREARALREHLDSLLAQSPAAKVVLWGDFNDTKNSPPLREAGGVHGEPSTLTPLPLADEQGTRWTHHWAEADVYSRIDFIFLSKNLLPYFDQSRSGVSNDPRWSKISDHRPLFLTFQIP